MAGQRVEKNRDDQRTRLRRALGALRPPEEITQEPFERNPRHLRRLAQLGPGGRAEAGDLLEYAHDLLYTGIQVPLLAYLLPFCLDAWRDDLRGASSDYGGFVEYFYPALDRVVRDGRLTPRQSEAVSGYMRQAVLDEIDDQSGLSFQGSMARPYRWIYALTTQGVLFPDVDRLWTEWWALGTAGRAVAAVQYISCLMYPDTENPVFAPWTRDLGGGPPCLWQFAGHLYSHRWLETNCDFLEQVLSVERVHDVLARAVDRLADHPEHSMAAQAREDFAALTATVAVRCVELPRLLAMNQRPMEWPV